MAEKQFIDLPPDTNIDGTEVIPVQEAAGGAGSTKEITIENLKRYFQWRGFVENDTDLPQTGNTPGDTFIVGSGIINPGQHPELWVWWIDYPQGGTPRWFRLAPHEDSGGALTPEAFAAFVASLPNAEVGEVGVGSFSAITDIGEGPVSREVTAALLSEWIHGWGIIPFETRNIDSLTAGDKFPIFASVDETKRTDVGTLAGWTLKKYDLPIQANPSDDDRIIARMSGDDFNPIAIRVGALPVKDHADTHRPSSLSPAELYRADTDAMTADFLLDADTPQYAFEMPTNEAVGTADRVVLFLIATGTTCRVEIRSGDHNGQVLGVTDSVYMGLAGSHTFTFPAPVALPIGSQYTFALVYESGDGIYVRRNTEAPSTPNVGTVYFLSLSQEWLPDGLNRPIGNVAGSRSNSGGDVIEGELLAVAGAPIHYTPTAANLGGHLEGIDDALTGGGGYSPSRTVSVDQDPAKAVPDQVFTTIQAAVDYVSPLANYTEPWVIELAPGNYTESIVTPGVNNMRFVTIKGPGFAYSPNNSAAVPVVWTVTTGTWTALDRCQFQFIDFRFSGDTIINTVNLLFFTDCIVTVADTAYSDGGMIMTRCNVSWNSTAYSPNQLNFYQCTGYFQGMVFNTDGNAQLSIIGGSIGGAVTWAGNPDWSPTNPRIYLTAAPKLTLAAELLPHTRWAQFMVGDPTDPMDAVNLETMQAAISAAPVAAHADTHKATQTLSPLLVGPGTVDGYSGFGGGTWEFENAVAKNVSSASVFLSGNGGNSFWKMRILDGVGGTILGESNEAEVIDGYPQAITFPFAAPVPVPVGTCAIELVFVSGVGAYLGMSSVQTVPASVPSQVGVYFVGQVGEQAIVPASDPLSGDAVAVAYVPTNYTEQSATLAGHLEGIDAALASALAPEAYTPAQDSDWTDPNPATLVAAIDRMAAEIVLLKGGPIA